MKKSFFISLVVFIIVLFATIGLYISKNNEKLDYTIVDCTVVSAEKEFKRFLFNRYFETNVIVSYKGSNYELQSPERKYHEYTYPKNKQIKAYLSNGKLYADEIGVRGDTDDTKMYFVSLFISAVSGIGLLTNIIIYNKNKKLKETN